jgi:hypothetical protein
MTSKVSLDDVYAHSDDVVAREIEGELIIVPLVAGIGDIENALFTLNPTGQAIWSAIDGARSLRDISEQLAREYEASRADIETDVIGLVAELASRKMLVPISEDK